MAPNWKPSRTARKKAEKERKTKRRKVELDAKAIVRKRDGYRCRFPLCGCDKLGLPLEVAHDQHKGMGGNPKGDRSTTAGMVLLCNHRHQFGAVSLHKGTLRAVFLSNSGFDGPIGWEVDTTAAEIKGRERWLMVAAEYPLEIDLLIRLGEMNR